MGLKNFSLALGFFMILANSQIGAQENVAQQFQGFNLSGYTDEGEKSWDVKGDTADILGDTVAITNVDANQYGEYPINIKAKKGLIDKSSGDIDLKEDVVITAENGSQLKTDTLKWQKEKDLVSTEDQVVLTDKTMVATGKGLQAKPQLQMAQLNQDVKVNVEADAGTPEQEPVTITCDGILEIDQRTSRAIFTDNVVAVSGNRKLKADRVEVFFDTDSQKLVKMICTGNVVITQDDNTTYSEKAVYDALMEKFILTGRPKLILIPENGDSLSSDFSQ